MSVWKKTKITKKPAEALYLQKPAADMTSEKAVLVIDRLLVGKKQPTLTTC